MDDQGIKMMNLKPTTDEKLQGFLDPIGIRVARSRIASQARSGAKLKNCFYCHSEVEGMCNSHSIPKFTIKNIAKDGKMIGYQQLLETPAADEDVGIKAACTFQIICRRCDSKVFQKYETPKSYENEPDNNILAQIAMKNHLVEISKKLEDVQVYNPVTPLISAPANYCQVAYKVAKADLDSHVNEFELAKSISEGKVSAKYRMGIYTKLNYVVPIAAQCCFALIAGLDGEIVNNVYDFHPNNHVQFLHLAIFPLENSSVVLLFTRESNSHYRKFLKMLRKLSETDQLSIIFYMLLLYSENFVLSKELPEEILKDENLKDAFSKHTMLEITDPNCNPITFAMKEYSLAKHASVPNLLHRDFAIVKYRDDGVSSTKTVE